MANDQATQLDTSKIANRRDRVRRGGTGYPVSVPVFVLGSLAMVVLVLLPLGHNHVTLSVGLIGGVALGIVGLVTSLFNLKDGRGRLLKLVLLVGVLALAVTFPLNRANSTLVDVGLFATFGIAVVGLNLTQGFAGQISLAQAAFFGIGAYVSQMFTQGLPVALGPVQFTFPRVPFLLAVLISVVVCFVFGLLIGFPALRVHGPWLAFVTIAFNGLAVLVMTNEQGLTNGTQGVRSPRPNVFGIELFDTWRYVMMCVAFLVLAALVVWFIVRSPWGRAFKSIRDNPGRASSLGVNVRTYTLLAFAIGSSLAGLGGALYAPVTEFIDPQSFTVGKSFSFLLATIVGGVGTLLGPFLGTAFITFLENRLRFLGDNYQIAFAGFVILMMLVAPKGIAGSLEALRGWISAKRSDRTDDTGGVK